MLLPATDAQEKTQKKTKSYSLTIPSCWPHHIAHIHREEVILAEWFFTFDHLRVIVNCWCSDFWRERSQLWGWHQLQRWATIGRLWTGREVGGWRLSSSASRYKVRLKRCQIKCFCMEFMNTWYKVSQWKKLWRTEAYRDSMSGPNNDSISACCSPRLVHKLHHLVITLRKLGPGPKWSPFSRTGNFHSFENYLHGGENMSRHPKMWFDWQIVRHRKLSENAQPCQLLSEGADITEQMQ